KRASGIRGQRIVTTTAGKRVAVVQAAPVVFDCAATLAKVRKLATDAAAGGAGLVLFPEAFISGYPRGISFGTVIGERTADGRDHFRRYWESSVDIPGPALDQLVDLAAELGIYLVIGVIERGGGTLYCTAAFVSPDGYLGKHRKVMPTAAERLVWGFGDGSTLPVFDTPFGRLGAVICWENYMPVTRAKYDFDVTGHYARPDLFHLEINEDPQESVVSIRRDTEPTA